MNNRKDLLQGPRLKNDETYDLERIAKTLLGRPQDVSFFYNDNKELEVRIDNVPYNLTDILRNRPDFEHFQFSNVELYKYAHLCLEQFRPISLLSHMIYILRAEFLLYREREKILTDDVNHLNRGAQYAVAKYTDSYSNIQGLLFYEGTSFYDFYIQSTPDQFKRVLTDIILTTCVASYALSQPLLKYRDEIRCTRLEISNPSKLFFSDKKKAAEKNGIYVHKGFTSFNCFFDPITADFKESDCRIKTISPGGFNPMGKRINYTTAAQFEDEIVFPPRTQFLYTEYKHEKPKFGKIEHHFVCVPVRSLDGIGPGSYKSPFREPSVLSYAKKLAANSVTGAMNTGLGLTSYSILSQRQRIISFRPNVKNVLVNLKFITGAAALGLITYGLFGNRRHDTPVTQNNVIRKNIRNGYR